jgi:hypothetical protein
VLTTAAMLFVPAASPRRVVAGTLEAIDASFYAVPANPPGGATWDPREVAGAAQCAERIPRLAGALPLRRPGRS